MNRTALGIALAALVFTAPVSATGALADAPDDAPRSLDSTPNVPDLPGRWAKTVGDANYSGPTATARFDASGEHTATDENEVRDTATTTFVADDAPKISLETPDTVTLGEAGTFTADVTDSVGNVTVTWRFDTGSVTGESVEHSFGSPGTETVVLVVEDEHGARLTKEIEVQVVRRDADRASETTSEGATGNRDGDSNGDDNPGGTPGFGVATVLVALLASALLARRRSDR